MAVKLHGIRELREPTPMPMQASGKVLRLPHSSKPAKKESAFWRFSIGRMLYFVLLCGGLSLAGYVATLHLLYVRAVGVVVKEVDRLAPREPGRIQTLLVQKGDVVTKGQPLLILDTSSTSQVSTQAARLLNQQEQALSLAQRRHLLEQREATLRAQSFAQRTKAQGLLAQHTALSQEREAVVRLVEEGAATQAEVQGFTQRLLTLSRERNMALSEAIAAESALPAIAKERKALVDAEPLLAKESQETQLTQSQLLAPRDGVVAWVGAQVGEMVGPQNPVVVLQSGTPRITAYVEPADAGALTAGSSVSVHLPTGGVAQGVVSERGALAAGAFDPGHPQALASVPPAHAYITGEVVPLEPTALASLPLGAPCEVRLKRKFPWL